MRFRAIVATGLALCLAACHSVPAQLIVVVDSDYDAGALTCVELVATDVEDGSRMAFQRLVVTEGTPVVGQVTFPFSFGVLPPRGDAGRAVRVEVRGYRPGAAPCPTDGEAEGRVRIARAAQTAFRTGLRLQLPLFLSRVCEGVWRSCSRCQTCAPDCDGAGCGAGACQSEEVRPEDLVQVEPGAELPDAGGALDAGLIDGGACTPDTISCAEDAECCSGLCSSGSMDCVSCRPSFEACTRQQECCTGICSSSRGCVACLSGGESCTSGGQCCSGTCEPATMTCGPL